MGRAVRGACGVCHMRCARCEALTHGSGAEPRVAYGLVGFGRTAAGRPRVVRACGLWAHGRGAEPR
eukprot:7383087-Prymnesium_polylepis.1